MDLNELKQRESRHSAVMVLLERSTNSLILTKRSDNLRAHPGEICFPGGIWEPGDKTLYDTALRELYEELGITADRVKLIKELSIEKTLLGAIIHPWLATIESITPYILNNAEVTSVLSIPMSLVQCPQNYRDIKLERNGHYFKSCQFIANQDAVWGATARIMMQLIW